jgi:hypothetical protein
VWSVYWFVRPARSFSPHKLRSQDHDGTLGHVPREGKGPTKVERDIRIMRTSIYVNVEFLIYLLDFFEILDIYNI